MAQLITVRLARADGCPWGFRLQGGKDFGTPLVIQKVNGGSPAEKAGLIAGDSVVKVNSTDVFDLRHKDAQDVIVRAGQSFEMTVQRGGSTWKPAVNPVGSLPRHQPVTNNISPVTKTSLATKKQDYSPIGTSHNLSPKGFSSHMNGDGPRLVNKQYNSPMALYSEQSIAETLSAQAEVLSTGAMGVNFKKNEKNYNASQSEVFKMLQETEKEPKTPEPVPETENLGVVSAPVPVSGFAGLRHVPAPENRPAPTAPTVAPGNPQLPPGQNICADCERLIVGVFVRIKDKNLHVECFKCATCGSSLKNVGYYNINNKLYCDIHAKLAARNNPPVPNLVPVTVPPGGKVPAGTISAALASHSLPSPSPLSPTGNQVAAPFQHSKQESLENYSLNNSQTIRKEDAVANLMSALTIASQKEYKENGTNTEPVFLSEKVIPINSYNNDTNTTISEPYPSAPVKYMSYKPQTGSSLSGPKPFSSVQPSVPTHAPIAPPLSNTLPRSASSTAMPERKEWPPSKPEEIPTASPLYIDPTSHNPTPHQQVSNPYHQQINPYSSNPHTSNPVSYNPHNPISQNPYSNVSLSESETMKSQTKAYSSSYEMSSQSYNALDHKMSICSAEVTNITGRRSATECVETISDTLDTQMLVNNITRERPKSPPPVHRKVEALTTAPNRPYTPIGGGGEQPDVYDFMKDVPPPPRQKMTMLSTLTTASERPFTPALSIGDVQEVNPAPPILEPSKPVPKKIESAPFGAKSASHIIPCPSAFKPFKPVTQSYRPEQADVPKAISSFPPKVPTSILGYQKNITQRQAQEQVQPIQKPVTTLQPGQYPPNNVHTTFQPVSDDSQQRQYLRVSSPLPRSVSPNQINKPPPIIPYYQADLVAHECPTVETNLFDPSSPAISKSPSPMPRRSTSPFPRTMTKSPAQGPLPNPLKDCTPKKVVKDERIIEAKQNFTTYIPKYQGRVEQIKRDQTSDQSRSSSYGLSQSVTQSQMTGGQFQTAQQSESYQNMQISQRALQQQNQQYKMSEVENMRHLEQLNKSQMQSLETSADNTIQIQRTKRCTEEFERTQKSKVIEIQKTGSGITQVPQNTSSGGSAFGQSYQKQIASQQMSSGPSVASLNVSGGGSSFGQGFQRQMSSGGAAFAGSSASQPRSYSLPGSSVNPKPFKPSPSAANAPSRAPASNQSASRPNVSQSHTGVTTGRQAGAIGMAPRRGRGILNLTAAAGSRVPLCGHCNSYVRGPFITALGKIWCPDHFVCTTPSCRRPLQDMGFVEERGQLYCEYCFEQYLAPTCSKCNVKIKGDCLNAIGKHFHPECFSCAYCSKLFGNSPFFLEDGLPYCEADWNELFTTKCFACGFPVEAGDRWVEALNNNYHSQCFNCTMCKKNLEGQSFYAKGGRPFCKNHAR